MARHGCWTLDERKFLDEAEQSRIRKSVRQGVARAGFKRVPWLEWFLIELALETGLRVGEMSGLVCGNLVTEISRPGIYVRNGKGGKSRYVRIRRKFIERIEDFFNWKEAAGESIDDDAPLFSSSRTGRHLTVRALQKAFERVCERAGVTDHSVHHCRHTYASELLRASGGNLRVVQKQLGHSKVTTTQVYADVFDSEMDEAIENMYGKPRKHS